MPNKKRKEIKFDPKELANSNRIYKSATPKQDLSWYIKWFASAVLLGRNVNKRNRWTPILGFNLLYYRSKWLVMGWFIMEGPCFSYSKCSRFGPIIENIFTNTLQHQHYVI